MVASKRLDKMKKPIHLQVYRKRKKKKEKKETEKSKNSLLEGNYAHRVGRGAHVYMAAEILELAGNAAREKEKSRI